MTTGSDYTNYGFIKRRLFSGLDGESNGPDYGFRETPSATDFIPKSRSILEEGVKGLPQEIIDRDTIRREAEGELNPEATPEGWENRIREIQNKYQLKDKAEEKGPGFWDRAKGEIGKYLKENPGLFDDVADAAAPGPPQLDNPYGRDIRKGVAKYFGGSINTRLPATPRQYGIRVPSVPSPPINGPYDRLKTDYGFPTTQRMTPTAYRLKQKAKGGGR